MGDVELPPWAHNLSRAKGRTPEETFLAVNRAALESINVSSNLHSWIDLIFGFKQKGQEAIEADNLFFHLTYENSVSDEALSRMDAVEIQALETQVQEFGQCPTQLFNDPHPPRLVSPPTPPFESFYRKSGLSSDTNDDNALSLLSSIVSAIDADAFKVESQTSQDQTTPFSSTSPSALQPIEATEPPSHTQAFPESVVHDLGNLGLLLKSTARQKDSLPRATTQPSPSLVQFLNDESRSLQVKEVKVSKDPINAVAMSGDGLLTICACNKGLLGGFEFGGSRSWRKHLEGDLLSLSMNSNSTLAIGSSLGTIHALSTQNEEVVHSWTAHDDSVCCLASSGSTLVSASYDCSVKVWDHSSLQRDEIRDFDSGVWALATSKANPDLIFTGTEEGLVESHDMRAPSGSRRIWSLGASRDYIGGIALESNLNHVIVATADGSILLLDSRMAGAKVESAKSSSPLRCLVFLESHSFEAAALAGNEKGVIEVFDLRGNMSAWPLGSGSNESRRAINSMAYLNDETLQLAIATEEGTLLLL